MADRNDVFKCLVCGNVVSVIIGNSGELTCCEKPMKKMMEIDPSREEGKEKHVPNIEIKDNNMVLVKLGKDISHPMELDHLIEEIELIEENGDIHICKLIAGDVPEALFKVKSTVGLKARAYCNLHGLWKSK